MTEARPTRAPHEARTVRTRFAPSPTGRLHLGNVRMAIFNWLFARHHGGAFIVRIEDTDVERNVPGAERALLDDLAWLGLDWDEGPDRGGPHTPYRQSARGALYQEAVRLLVAAGKAYRCYCTDDELAVGRERVGEREVHRYAGRCRPLSQEQRHALEASGRGFAVRFAAPEGLDAIQVVDEVRGTISFPASDFDDFVIQRTDGRVTYNFAVVVDDVDMDITHVIRGVGHLSNTPKQALLFDAMGHPRPRFAHLPHVLAPEGGKLSKREGGFSLDLLRDRGYDPDGIVNYLSLLGWSSPDEREVLSRDELVDRISLERVGSSDTAFDLEKLAWVSGRHLAELDLPTLVERVRPFVDEARFPLRGEPLQHAVAAVRTRLSTYGEIGTHLEALFPPADVLEGGRAELASHPGALPVLEEVTRRLESVEAWAPAALGAAVRDAGKAVGARGPELFHPVRLALAGATSGPDLSLLLAAIGREEAVARLRRVLDAPGSPG